MAQAPKDHFDLDAGLTYLNSGTHSIAPREVLEAVTRYQREYEKNPTAHLFGAWGRLWKAQCALAGFLGARGQDLFLRSNITQSLNAMILGTKLPPGSEILLSSLEYGAIANICRFRAERDGLKLRRIELPVRAGEVSSAQILEKVRGALRPETGMLVLSHVMTATGLVIPLKDIARETRRNGTALVVDGAHATGALELDLGQLGDVDFYAGNCHKWLMGPKGTSFGWVHPSWQDRVVPVEAGWTSYECPKPFEKFGEGSSFALRMLSAACHDFAPFFALEDMLAFWARLGASNIRARLKELRSELDSRISTQLGWVRLTPKSSEGPILAYELPAEIRPRGYELMAKLLFDHRLQVALSPLDQNPALADPGWAVRFTPHIYNDSKDLERGVQVLAMV